MVERFLTFGSGGSGREDLLQLPAGRAWLSRFTIGRGQAYLFASGLKKEDSNLPEHPFFVPLLLKMAFTSAVPSRMFYAVGRDQFLEAGNVSLTGDQSLRLVAENFQAIPEYSRGAGMPRLYVADQIRDAGFYDLMKGDSLLSVIAFNNLSSESDMRYSSEKDIKEVMGDQKFSFFDTGSDSLPDAGVATAGGREFWKLCLFLSLLFLAAEILIIKYFNKFQRIKA
ncbi:MAG: hypothetical protein EOP49_52695 [Sphingobacteriales bacterium]|nr:MAG: hypothetical protein EOP49_52695 [Sphingobacteriales bacterium]